MNRKEKDAMPTTMKGGGLRGQAAVDQQAEAKQKAEIRAREQL